MTVAFGRLSRLIGAPPAGRGRNVLAFFVNHRSRVLPDLRGPIYGRAYPKEIRARLALKVASSAGSSGRSATKTQRGPDRLERLCDVVRQADMRHRRKAPGDARGLGELGGERGRRGANSAARRRRTRARGSRPDASFAALRPHRPRPTSSAPRLAERRLDRRLPIAAGEIEHAARRGIVASQHLDQPRGVGRRRRGEPPAARFRRARRSRADDIERRGAVDRSLGEERLGAGGDDRVIAPPSPSRRAAARSRSPGRLATANPSRRRPRGAARRVLARAKKRDPGLSSTARCP